MSEVTREEVLNANPLLAYLTGKGINLKGEGGQRTGNRCPERQHANDHWPVTVTFKDGIWVWHCNDCDHGGTIVDWLAWESGRSGKDVYKELVQKLENKEPKRPTPCTSKPAGKTPVAIYDYTDERGRLLYQVCRYDPKDFRQRRPDGKGGWIPNMEGVTRLPYRLPAVLTATEVVIVEGEKDADNMTALGFVATCNVGGAGKWLEAYSELFSGKDIIVIPDNDDPGVKHADEVAASLMKYASSLRVVVLPKPSKDASEYIATFSNSESAIKGLRDLINKTPHSLKPLPVYSMAELEEQYIRFIQQLPSRTFDLGKLLPSLGEHVRKLVPGELVAVLSDTGMGKTALLQSLARSAKPLPTLFFELELPSELMFERYVQMETGRAGETVQQSYLLDPTPKWKTFTGLNHILVCPESGLSVDRIENYLNRSELRFGMKPVVVFIDYIGLISSPGSRGRYEAISNAAEDIKVMAKRTGTIVVIAVQISRPDKKTPSLEVRLHDAKDSGSIENSAGLVLGAWRPDQATLILRVLKNTKGPSGKTIDCNFDGEKMRITERAPSRYT